MDDSTCVQNTTLVELGEARVGLGYVRNPLILSFLLLPIGPVLLLLSSFLSHSGSDPGAGQLVRQVGEKARLKAAGPAAPNGRCQGDRCDHSQELWEGR